MADWREGRHEDGRESDLRAQRGGCFLLAALLNALVALFLGWLVWVLIGPSSGAPFRHMTHANWIVEAGRNFQGIVPIALTIAGWVLLFNLALCAITVEMRSWRGRGRWLLRAFGLTLLVLLAMLGSAWAQSLELVENPPDYFD